MIDFSFTVADALITMLAHRGFEIYYRHRILPLIDGGDLCAGACRLLF